jgi:hypothetical protein
MKGLTSSGAAAGLIAAMTAGAGWALLHVGATAHVPVHFDMAGTPTDYAPAWFGLFVLPAFGGLVWMMPAILPRIDPRGENVLRSGPAIGTILLTRLIHRCGAYPAI